MADRRAFVTLATGSDSASAIHMRLWEFPADEEAIERVAALLTEACGEPHEVITDDAGSGPARVFVFGGDGGGGG